MTATMMQCGHSTNATNSQGQPCCVICIGIHPGADVVAATPDLGMRQSRCDYCKSTRPSKLSLPFFSHRPKMEFDSHYDGCRGWE